MLKISSTLLLSLTFAFGACKSASHGSQVKDLEEGAAPAGETQPVEGDQAEAGTSPGTLASAIAHKAAIDALPAKITMYKLDKIYAYGTKDKAKYEDADRAIKGLNSDIMSVLPGVGGMSDADKTQLSELVWFGGSRMLTISWSASAIWAKAEHMNFDGRILDEATYNAALNDPTIKTLIQQKMAAGLTSLSNKKNEMLSLGGQRLAGDSVLKFSSGQGLKDFMPKSSEFTTTMIVLRRLQPFATSEQFARIGELEAWGTSTVFRDSNFAAYVDYNVIETQNYAAARKTFPAVPGASDFKP